MRRRGKLSPGASNDVSLTLQPTGLRVNVKATFFRFKEVRTLHGVHEQIKKSYKVSSIFSTHPIKVIVGKNVKIAQKVHAKIAQKRLLRELPQNSVKYHKSMFDHPSSLKGV